MGVMVRIAARVAGVGFVAATAPLDVLPAFTAAGWGLVEFNGAKGTEFAFDEPGVIVLGADRMAGTVDPPIVPVETASVDGPAFGWVVAVSVRAERLGGVDAGGANEVFVEFVFDISAELLAVV